MVLFNYSTKELTAKIVYYGAGLCGKTTNLQWIHEQLPIKNKGKMLSLATEADRTLFFDFLPIELGTIRGMKTRVQLYTVPGQVFYNATRRMVLKGADCVIFVADSQEAMIDANVDAMKNLRENLVANELDADHIPLVIQYNKRDLPNAASLADLNKALNTRGVPFVEASAKSGKGVEETLKVATQLVFKVLASKYGSDGAASSGRNSEAIQKSAPTVKPAAPAPPPPPMPAPARVAPPLPPPAHAAAPNHPPNFASNDDLLDSLGGPGPAPSVDLGNPLDALSASTGPVAVRSKAVDPFGPELSLDSLGEAPASGPGDPFGSPLDSSFAAPAPSNQPSPLDDPFGSSLEETSPFDSPPPSPEGSGSPLDSMMELEAAGGSSSFTSDPVSVEASVDVPAGSLRANPVQVSVPIELTVSGSGRDILIPIRLQLRIRIR